MLIFTNYVLSLAYLATLTVLLSKLHLAENVINIADDCWIIVYTELNEYLLISLVFSLWNDG